jgi:hypothetical protein
MEQQNNVFKRIAIIRPAYRVVKHRSILFPALACLRPILHDRLLAGCVWETRATAVDVMSWGTIEGRTH